ncbi:MAG: hypothetical protein KJ675_07215 [Gammaproteobacteria bacterium]|nr:hypothetical protein [Gammaproteobacteria bacterium]MBU1960997.1 hypothetical protein [Gammaproteobacteria bacterium]
MSEYFPVAPPEINDKMKQELLSVLAKYDPYYGILLLCMIPLYGLIFFAGDDFNGKAIGTSTVAFFVLSLYIYMFRMAKTIRAIENTYGFIYRPIDNPSGAIMMSLLISGPFLYAAYIVLLRREATLSIYDIANLFSDKFLSLSFLCSSLGGMLLIASILHIIQLFRINKARNTNR